MSHGRRGRKKGKRRRTNEQIPRCLLPEPAQLDNLVRDPQRPFAARIKEGLNVHLRQERIPSVKKGKKEGKEEKRTLSPPPAPCTFKFSHTTPSAFLLSPAASASACSPRKYLAKSKEVDSLPPFSRSGSGKGDCWAR